MFHRTRLGSFLFCVAALALFVRFSAVGLLVRLVPAHQASKPAAKWAEPLLGEVDEHLEAAPPIDVPAAVSFALARTASHLHFGQKHTQSLRFDGREREGHWVEYAHLFAALFEKASRAGKLDAHAFVVRSEIKVLGVTLPLQAWQTHDWVLVVEKVGEDDVRYHYIDPTLQDVYLDPNVERIVEGKEKLLPLVQPKAIPRGRGGRET